MRCNSWFDGASLAVPRLAHRVFLPRWGRRLTPPSPSPSPGPLAWASRWRRAVGRGGDVGEGGRAFLESNVKKMPGPVPAPLPSRDVFGAHLGTLVRYLVLLGLSWGPVGGC